MNMVKATLAKTERYTISKEIISNDSKNGLEYNAITMDYPKQLSINYEVSIWCQYIKQMNQIVEAILNAQEFTQSFVIIDETGYRYNAIIENSIFNSEDNLKNADQEERIIRKSYTFRITTPIVNVDSIRQEKIVTKIRFGEGVA
jgi:hypothetical protein